MPERDIREMLWQQSKLTMLIQEGVALAPWTTLRVGGPARYFAEARSEEEVREAVEFSRERSLPLFVLGGGSNLVVADAGWPGLVLKMSLAGVEVHADGDRVVFDVGAGVVWDDFVAKAVGRNCAGIECLSGIPGSTGGTPVQNVGAYGQEVSATIEAVRVLDLKSDRVIEMDNAACGFGYRASIFNTAERGRHIILRVKFHLCENGKPTLKYADLQKHFDEKTQTLGDVRRAVCEIRRSKGMLIVPGDPDSRSVGSFFKNPVLSEVQFDDVSSRAGARGFEIPNYPASDGQHKVSAAWLVEHSGFSKGYRLGAAGISHKHALALVNPGEATAADIIQLKSEIQMRVGEEWGLFLEPEPVFVGALERT